MTRHIRDNIDAHSFDGAGEYINDDRFEPSLPMKMNLSTAWCSTATLMFALGFGGCGSDGATASSVVPGEMPAGEMPGVVPGPPSEDGNPAEEPTLPNDEGNLDGLRLGSDETPMSAPSEPAGQPGEDPAPTPPVAPPASDNESEAGTAVDPALAALLLEGVGNIVRPPPYAYGPYAQRRDDVPHGTVREFTFDEDAFYPESPARGIKVYEPAQYEEGQEVFLSVVFDGTAGWAYLSNNTDGGTYRTLNVLDNLIAEKLIPPFIGVFIGNDGDEGHRQSELAPTDDKQARFILEAVLPAVSERYGYNFSSDPKKRSITGESSGGNAAFTVAWNRPDAFHRMMGHSSSFSFGPAARLPDTVRMTEEVKPLRIHLEGGINDGPHHERMAAALAEKGYVYEWFNSTGSGHGGPGGDTSFPDGLIWLWRGWEQL